MQNERRPPLALCLRRKGELAGYVHISGALIAQCMWLNKNHRTMMPPGTPKIHAKRYFIVKFLRAPSEQWKDQSAAER